MNDHRRWGIESRSSLCLSYHRYLLKIHHGCVGTMDTCWRGRGCTAFSAAASGDGVADRNWENWWPAGSLGLEEKSVEKMIVCVCTNIGGITIWIEGRKMNNITFYFAVLQPVMPGLPEILAQNVLVDKRAMFYWLPTAQILQLRRCHECNKN